MAELDIVIKAQNQTGGVLGGLKNELSGLDGMAQGVGKSFGGLQSVIGGAFKVAAVGAGVGIAALGAGLVKAVAAGSDVEEMMGKFNVVFANTGAMVTEQLDDFAGAVGRNKFELREMAATFGDTLKPMGFTEDAAAGLAVDLSKLATDLGSFNNMPMDEALRRLQGTLIGSHENALAFGVVINENTMKAEMLAQGWSELTGAELEAAKVQARINLLMKGTTDAQGDAARTSGSWANVMRRLQSTLQETAAEIGTKLLPVITPLLSRLADMASVYGPQVIDVFQQFLTGVVSITEAVISWDTASLPLLGTLQTIYEQVSNVIGPIADAISSFIGWQDVLIALGVVIASVVIPAIVGMIVAASPMILLFGAIAGTVALLRKGWETDFMGMRTALIDFWENKIKPAFEQLQMWAAENLPGALATLSDFWENTLLPAIKVVWTFIRDNLIPLFRALVDVWFAAIRVELALIASVWENILKPALTALWEFFRDKIIPIFDSAGGKIGGVVSAIQGAIGWAQSLAGALNGFADNIGGGRSLSIQTAGAATGRMGGRGGDNYNIYQQVYGAQPAEVGRASRDGVLEANRRRGR
jgi:hypothetical protein